MLQFEERQPKFDVAMELLCSLPKSPAAASLRALADDFGYDNSQPIVDLLKILAKRGYLIDRFRKDDEPCASVRAVGWASASRAAEVYWRGVCSS